jgi:hypothetical protein
MMPNHALQRTRPSRHCCNELQRMEQRLLEIEDNEIFSDN